jgi:hypothetical protein
LADVDALVKKLFAVGAVTLVTNVPGVEVTPVTNVPGVEVTPVTNVPGVGFTPVTTVVFVVVPFMKGTVSKGPMVPALVGLVKTIVPLLLVVVVPLGLKANTDGGPLLFCVISTATVRRFGLDDPGVMPVTVPVVAPTSVTAVPVGALILATAVLVGAFTLATAVLVGAFTLVTAVPVAIPVPLRNEFCVVVTLANVGVTAVTTSVPGNPLTPVTTLVKVGVTLVTHVAAEAEDISAALKLPTETAARSVWFGPDSNIASDQVVALRSTTDALILPPIRSRSGLARLDCSDSSAKIQKLFGRNVLALLSSLIPSIFFVTCCKSATSDNRPPASGSPERQFFYRTDLYSTLHDFLLRIDGRKNLPTNRRTSRLKTRAPDCARSA